MNMLFEQLKDETLLFFALHSFILGIIVGAMIMKARMKHREKLIEELRLRKQNEEEYKKITGADAA